MPGAINENSPEGLLSQATYAGSPYEDSSWEVVGAPPQTEEFVPLQFTVLPGEWTTTDPMFADYGGIPAEQNAVRWHLPDQIAYQPRGAAAAEVGAADSGMAMAAAELEQIRQAAYEEGQRDAREEAQQEAAAERQVLEERLQALYQDLKSQSSENLLELEKRAIDLALQISHKIIGEAVEINPEYILPVLREALALAGTAAVKAIRISPADLEFVKLVGIDRDFRDAEDSWEFTADETIKAGCIVETAAGEIDYQLDAAWERIKAKVVRLIK